MKFTLGQAAKRLGLSKPTVSKHIRNGRLAGVKGADGVFQIDAAELARFEAEYRRVPPVQEADVDPVVTVAGDVALAVAEERAKQLQERLEETAARLAAAEARADAAQARADEAWSRVAGLLEAPKGQDSWWKRITGKLD